jgi:hypothetical protein
VDRRRKSIHFLLKSLKSLISQALKGLKSQSKSSSFICCPMFSFPRLPTTQNSLMFPSRSRLPNTNTSENSEPSIEFSYTPPLVPLTLTWSSSGGWSVEAGARWATPVGTFEFRAVQQLPRDSNKRYLWVRKDNEDTVEVYALADGVAFDVHVIGAGDAHFHRVEINGEPDRGHIGVQVSTRDSSSLTREIHEPNQHEHWPATALKK